MPTITLYFTDEYLIPFMGIYPPDGEQGIAFLQRDPFPLSNEDVDKWVASEKSLSGIVTRMFGDLVSRVPLPSVNSGTVGIVSDGRRYDDLLNSLEQVEPREVNGIKFKAGTLKGLPYKAELYKVTELEGRVVSYEVDMPNPGTNTFRN